MWKLLKNCIKSGHWAQCKFCRRAFPTKDWSKSPTFNKSYSDSIIEKSGYCTYCERHGLKI